MDSPISTTAQRSAQPPLASDSRQNAWHQAHRFLREIEDELLRLPEETQRGEAPMRLLVERLPAILDALNLAHQDLDTQIAQRTAELSQANVELHEQVTEVARAERSLANAEKALVLKEVELSIARQIQEGLVAKALPPALGGFDIAGASHCAAETGGDYFDFFPLLESRQGDACQGIVIADASGHGLGPALLITETRAYLRAFALTSEDIGRIVSLVNCRIAEDVGDDHYVTLFLARLDSRTRSLHYTSAGHPRGCIFDSSGSVKALLESTGPPLGVFANCDFPSGLAIMLQPGDLVLLLTDGILEAVAPDNTAFGMQRTIDIVRVYRKDAAALIVHNLYHAVRAFAHNHTQVDDMTAVVIKVREVLSTGNNRPVEPATA